MNTATALIIGLPLWIIAAAQTYNAFLHKRGNTDLAAPIPLPPSLEHALQQMQDRANQHAEATALTVNGEAMAAHQPNGSVGPARHRPK